MNSEFKLRKTGNRLPYKVPENYFEDFAERMDVYAGSNKISVKKMIRPWMYMAAMFVGLLFMANFFLQNHKSNIASVETDNYDLYMLSHVDESVVADYYLAVSED